MRRPAPFPSLLLLAGGLLLAGVARPAHSQEVVVGTGQPGFTGDGGPASSAELNAPQAVLPAPDGSLYLADAGNHRVRQVDPQGQIETVFGDGTPDTLTFPSALALDAQDGLWVLDSGGQRIFRGIDAEGWTLLTVNGFTEARELPADLGVSPTSILFPSGVIPEGDGVLVTEMGAGRVLHLDTAGNFSLAWDGLESPYGLARDVDGALLLADYGAGTILRQDRSGIETIASLLPIPSDDVDYPVDLPLPGAIAVGPDGSLYVSFPDIGTIGRIDPDNNVSTFLASPPLDRPVGLAVTPGGQLLIADEGLNEILSQTLSFPPPLPGDVNGDGTVTVQDAILALRMLTGTVPFNRRAFLAADLASPGSDSPLTIEDVVMILRAALGL